VVGNLILGIESSCDETSAAVLRDGYEVLSNVVASQLVHADYGGVVPELASREHLRAIVPVVREALQRANCTYQDLDAVAVTSGPGLAGALLVGITFAKALAFGLGKPLIAVNHLEGHIHAVLMQTAPDFSSQTEFAPPPQDFSSRPESASFADEVERPAFSGVERLLALVVSGGHTHLYLATRTPRHTWTYRNVGKTLDDAAGEAYDKVAKLLGLPYPGGPWMDALAAHGAADTTLFPYAQIKQKATGNTAPKLSRELAAQKEQAVLKGTGFSPYIGVSGEDRALAPEGAAFPSKSTLDKRFDMSFSGLKTAVRRYVEIHAMQPAIAAREAALRAGGLLHAKPSDPAALSAALQHFDAQTLNLIASFQNAVVKNLARSTFAAAEHFAACGVLVSGGVSANIHLRSVMTNMAVNKKLPIAFPTIALSTDNAAMIAAAAWPKFLARDFASRTLEPTPQLRLG
jgi:N6-L-threonylcarbamoyladenine synthase